MPTVVAVCAVAAVAVASGVVWFTRGPSSHFVPLGLGVGVGRTNATDTYYIGLPIETKGSEPLRVKHLAFTRTTPEITLRAFAARSADAHIGTAALRPGETLGFALYPVTAAVIAPGNAPSWTFLVEIHTSDPTHRHDFGVTRVCGTGIRSHRNTCSKLTYQLSVGP